MLNVEKNLDQLPQTGAIDVLGWLWSIPVVLPNNIKLSIYSRIETAFL